MDFIGHKGAAFLDLWSISHFLLGIALGTLPLRFLSITRRVILKSQTASSETNYPNATSNLVVFLFAFSWEALEFGLEAGLVGETVKFWLQGHEHWLNRLISDPLLVLLGYQFVHWAPRFVWPSRFLLLIWGWAFLIVLPHSMAYLE